ncbi:MAG: hypothetical protein ACPG77_17705, partial [Nannocystaceae bacterium]
MRPTLVGLGVCLALASCQIRDDKAIYEEIISKISASDSDSGSSTTGVQPTTGPFDTDTLTTSTTGGPEGGGDLPPAAPEFALSLTASTEKLKRAGSIVLTAEFEGEPTSLELRVAQDGMTIDLPQ